MNRWGYLVLATVFLVACEASSPPPPSRSREGAPTASPTDPSLSAEERPQVTALPRHCTRWEGKSSGPEITFSVQGRLFSLDPATGDVHCLDRNAGIEMEWGAGGDRLLTTSPEAVAKGGGFHRRFPGDNRYETWSRPKGTSVIYVTHDFKQLLKEDVATGEVTDLSFLDQHLDVTYHPAGTHLAVAGELDGRMGLFLATNEGTEVQEIVRGEKAEQIDELGFSHDGRRLYFRAMHDDRIDLHAIQLATGEEAGSVADTLVWHTLKTIFSGDKAPHYAVSPFGRGTRLLYGPCVPGEARVRMGIDESELDPSLGAVDPVGWLPDGSVVFIAYDGRCDDFGEGDLYSWRDGHAALLVENVDGAAIRARLPKAPDPPTAAQEVVA